MNNLQVAQTKALNAISQNSKDLLLSAIAEGARLDLTTSGEEPDFTKDQTIRSKYQSLLGVAVWYAKNFRTSSHSNLLQVIKDKGVNLVATLEAAVDPKSAVDEYPAMFMLILIDNWPISFGKWEDFFNLHVVAEKRDIKKLGYLIERGADPNQRDSNGLTPLMMANSEGVVKKLLESGAEIQALDLEGKTALYHATRNLFKKSTKGEDGIVYVGIEDCKTVIELFKKNSITQDPYGHIIARTLCKKIERGFRAVEENDMIEGEYMFHDIMGQLNEYKTKYKRERLETLLNKNRSDGDIYSIKTGNSRLKL